jgi:DNA-binding NarL/FixJ family response regulator
MAAIRILIADDHQFFRRGLVAACEAEGFEVVGEAENGQQAVDLARDTQPDVILMDIKMPIVDGVQATRLIVEENPAARVIILTTFQRDEYVFDALRSGASGYLLKDAREEDLARGVRSVAQGGVLLDDQVAVQMIGEFRRLGQADPVTMAGMEQLTKGEREVLQQVAAGLDNAEIAAELHLSEKTVANRVSVIYSKLRVKNRVQAALYALRRGWAELHPDE